MQGSKPCNVCAMPWGGRPQDPAHVRRSCLHTPHIFPTTPSGMFCTHTLVLVAQQLCMLRSTAPVRGVQVAEGERPGGTCTASASRCDTAPLAQATGYCTGTAPCCSPGAPHPSTCGLLASAMAQGCATWHPGGGLRPANNNYYGHCAGHGAYILIRRATSCSPSILRGKAWPQGWTQAPLIICAAAAQVCSHAFSGVCEVATGVFQFLSACARGSGQERKAT